MELGWIHDGGLMFVLAGGDISDYVSSNPPIGWMQATLPTIGSKSLRDIALPESHDAGMSELTSDWTKFLGIDHNTRTQSFHIYKQLQLGVRWFDIRPAHYKGHWYTGHFSHTLGKHFVGNTGRTIENIVRDINRFTAEHPGELIVLDITHDYDVDNWIAPLNDELWQKLFRELSNINDPWIPPKDNLPEDLSTVPISTFITPGSRSAVIVVLPDHVHLPQDPPKNSKRSSAYADAGFLYADLPHEAPPDGIPFSEVNFDFSDPEVMPPIDETNGFGDYEGWEDFEWTTWWLLFGNSTTHDGSNSTSPILTDSPDMSDTPTNATPHIFPRRVQSTLNTPITPVGPWAKAFIHGKRVPSTGSYSDTRWDVKMGNDQRAKLGALRPSPTSPLHHTVWTLTQWWTDVVDFLIENHSIMGMARIAHHNLLRDIWKSPTQKGVTFPNLIQMDNIRDNSLAALCVVLNKKWSITTNAVAVKRDGLRTFAQRRTVGKVETVTVNETLVDASD
jgi:hypothetical protein